MSDYRLGFLLCDHAMEHLADRFGDYPLMFERAFAEVSDSIDWRVFDITKHEIPHDGDDCDGYLISGSRHGAYDDLSWLPQLENFIRANQGTDKPLVGLCFGHQVIAQALGGRVAQSDAGWGIGIHRYDVAVTAAWMKPGLADFVVPVCHQDQVIDLPQGAKRLARNSHCENFVVQFSERTLGIQGHPEFSPQFVSELVEWRRERMPAATYQDARNSLTAEHHNKALKTWICRFLGVTLKHG